MLFIFDVGGVLTNTSKEQRKLAEIVGLPFDEWTKITDDLFSDENLSSQEFWRIFNERTGKNITVDWIHLLFHPELNMETVALIKELKSKGHRVVAGTNTCPGHYQNHIERGDYQFFDQTYASIFMGTHKPDLDFWKIIMKAENDISPEDCIFIDDKMKNIEAASEIGMHAILFTTVDEVKSKIYQILETKQ